ncbi:MAG: ATP-binding protein [Gemmatimonadota bacterium]
MFSLGLEANVQPRMKADHPEAVAVSEIQTSPELRVPAELEQATKLLEELPGAVLLLDASGRVVFLNRIAEGRIDHTRADALGRDFFRELLPQLEQEGWGKEYRTGMREHPMSICRATAAAVAGGERAISIAIRSYEVSGERWGLVLIEDRSALQGEAARRQRAERLAAVGELAAGAAHEINNPLASIKGFAQLLARETLDRGQQQALEIISQECTRVAGIVDNLLGFAIQQQTVAREQIDLSEVADSILALKRYGLETSGVVLDLDLDSRLSTVEAERGAIQRLLLILLQHAERSLTRKEGDRRLTVRTRESNEGVVLHISDNGPGFPRHRLPFLLDVEADPETGLGLSSADAIAREHRGMLWVESGEGNGATFTVRLPRSKREREAPTEPPPREVPIEAPTPFRVLVADDEPTLRLALTMFLDRHGFEVEQAEDATEAYRMATSRSFDVALVDVRMPGDGLVLIERLESSADWSGHAVLMTGDHTATRVRDEIRRGRPHLTKPFDMMEAVRLIERLSGSRASPSGQQAS